MFSFSRCDSTTVHDHSQGLSSAFPPASCCVPSEADTPLHFGAMKVASLGKGADGSSMSPRGPFAPSTSSPLPPGGAAETDKTPFFAGFPVEPRTAASTGTGVSGLSSTSPSTPSVGGRGGVEVGSVGKRRVRVPQLRFRRKAANDLSYLRTFSKAYGKRGEPVVWCKRKGRPWWPGLLANPDDPNLVPPLPPHVRAKQFAKGDPREAGEIRLLFLCCGTWRYWWTSPKGLKDFRLSYAELAPRVRGLGLFARLAVQHALEECDWKDNADWCPCEKIVSAASLMQEGEDEEEGGWLTENACSSESEDEADGFMEEKEGWWEGRQIPAGASETKEPTGTASASVGSLDTSTSCTSTKSESSERVRSCGDAESTSVSVDGSSTPTRMKPGLGDNTSSGVDVMISGVIPALEGAGACTSGRMTSEEEGENQCVSRPVENDVSSKTFSSKETPVGGRVKGRGTGDSFDETSGGAEGPSGLDGQGGGPGGSRWDVSVGCGSNLPYSCTVSAKITSAELDSSSSSRLSLTPRRDGDRPELHDKEPKPERKERDGSAIAEAPLPATADRRRSPSPSGARPSCRSIRLAGTRAALIVSQQAPVDASARATAAPVAAASPSTGGCSAGKPARGRCFSSPKKAGTTGTGARMLHPPFSAEPGVEDEEPGDVHFLRDLPDAHAGNEQNQVCFFASGTARKERTSNAISEKESEDRSSNDAVGPTELLRKPDASLLSQEPGRVSPCSGRITTSDSVTASPSTLEVQSSTGVTSQLPAAICGSRAPGVSSTNAALSPQPDKGNSCEALPHAGAAPLAAPTYGSAAEKPAESTVTSNAVDMPRDMKSAEEPALEREAVPRVREELPGPPGQAPAISDLQSPGNMSFSFGQGREKGDVSADSSSSSWSETIWHRLRRQAEVAAKKEKRGGCSPSFALPRRCLSTDVSTVSPVVSGPDSAAALPTTKDETGRDKGSLCSSSAAAEASQEPTLTHQVLSSVCTVASPGKDSAHPSSLSAPCASSNRASSSGTVPSYATILKATQSSSPATATPVPTYGTILENSNSSSFPDSQQPAHVRAAFAAGAAAIAMAAAAAASAQAEKDQKRRGANVSQGITKRDKKVEVEGAGCFQRGGEDEALSSEKRDRNPVTDEEKGAAGDCGGLTAQEGPRINKEGGDAATGAGGGGRMGLGPQSGPVPSEVVAKAVAAAAEVTARVLGGAEGEGGENPRGAEEKEEDFSEKNGAEEMKDGKRENAQEGKSYMSRRFCAEGIPHRANRRKGGPGYEFEQGKARRRSRSMATVADSSSGESRSRSRARQSSSGHGSSRRRPRSGHFRSKRRSHSPSVSRSVSSCSLSPPQSFMARDRARRRSARGLPVSKRRRRGSFSSRRSSLCSSRSVSASSSFSRSSSRSLSRSRGRARYLRKSKHHPHPRRRPDTSSSSPRGRDRSPRRRWSSSSRSRVSSVRGRGLGSSFSPPASRRAGRYNSRDWRGRGRRGRRSSPPYSPFSSSIRRRSPSAPDGYSNRWRFADRGGPGRSHWRGGPWQNDYNGGRRGGPSPFRETFGRGGWRRRTRDSSRSRSSSSPPPSRDMPSRGRKSGGGPGSHPEVSGGSRRGRRDNSIDGDLLKERVRDKRKGATKGSLSRRSSSSERSPDSLSPSSPSEKRRWDRKRSRRGPQKSEPDQASSSSFSVTPKTTREEEKEQKGQEKSFQIQEPVAAAKMLSGLLEGETSPGTASKGALVPQDGFSGQAGENSGQGSSVLHGHDSAETVFNVDRPTLPFSALQADLHPAPNPSRSAASGSRPLPEQAFDSSDSVSADNGAKPSGAASSASLCGDRASETQARSGVSGPVSPVAPSQSDKVAASQTFAVASGSACESGERSVSFLSEEEMPEPKPSVGPGPPVSAGAPVTVSSGACSDEVAGSVSSGGTGGWTSSEVAVPALFEGAAELASPTLPDARQSDVHAAEGPALVGSSPAGPASVFDPASSSGVQSKVAPQQGGGQEREGAIRGGNSTLRSLSAQSEAVGRGRSLRRKSRPAAKEDCPSLHHKQGETHHYKYAGKHRIPSTEEENEDEGKVFSRSSRSGSFSSRLSPSSSPLASRKNAGGEDFNGLDRGTRGRGGREGRRDTPGWGSERKDGSRRLPGSKQRWWSKRRPRNVSSNSSCEFDQSLSPPPTRGGQSSRRFLEPGELSSRSRGTPLLRGLSSRSEQPPYRMTTSEYRDYAARRVRDLHAKGRCVPCRYFWRRYGCKHGDLCKFCHNRSHDGSMLGLDEPPGDRPLGYSGESDLGGSRRSVMSSGKGTGGKDRHGRRDRSCSSSVSHAGSCRARDRRSRRGEGRGRGGRSAGLDKQGPGEGETEGEAYECSDRVGGTRRRGQGVEVDDDTPGRWVDQTQSSDEEGAKEDESREEIAASKEEKAPDGSEGGKDEALSVQASEMSGVKVSGEELKEEEAAEGGEGDEKNGLASSGEALDCLPCTVPA